MMHPSPFAEDDKQWPGEDVTSTSQHQIFDKNSIKNQKVCESKWPTWQVVETKKGAKKDRRTQPRPRKEEKTLTQCGRTRKMLGFVSSPQKSAFLIQKRSEIPISHSEEDEENREFNRNMSERPILIDSDVISIDLQIYDDVGSARSL